MRLDKVAIAMADQVRKKTSLIESLPTRSERLQEIRDETTQLEIEIANADGNYKSGMVSARDSARYGFQDMAHQNEAAAKTWQIAKTGFEEKLPELEAERARLAAITDEDYLVEQKHLRGLD